VSTTRDDDDNDAGGDASVDNLVRVDFGARRLKPAPPPTARPPSSTELGTDRPEKLRQFARLIERGQVMLTLDPRVDNARVPAQFSSELQLNLNFSHRFGLDDFDYDDEGVRASLSFGGKPFFCDIPWTAVYGMTSHVDGEERLMWPDSFPRELAPLLPAQARHTPEPLPSPEPDPPEPPPSSPRPTLRRVK